MFCYWYTFCLILVIIQHNRFRKQLLTKQLLTGNLNGTYNIICFSVAFALIPIARRLGAKRLHFVSLAIGGIGLLCMPLLNDTDLLFTLPFGDGIAVSQIYLFSFGLGITWASMMAMPYEMLASSIPRQDRCLYGNLNMYCNTYDYTNCKYAVFCLRPLGEQSN